MEKRDAKTRQARRLRGIYFIDPDDREHSEILKNAVAPAMPCAKHEIASQKIPKDDLWLYGGLMNPQGNEWNLLRLQNTKIGLQVKDLPEIPDAKAAVDKEWKKLETIPAWQLEKSQE